MQSWRRVIGNAPCSIYVNARRRWFVDAHGLVTTTVWVRPCVALGRFLAIVAVDGLHVALPVIPVRGRHRDTGSGDATCSLRLVDPHRGGDLPRTIVIRADGSRTAISGELTEKQLAQIAP
jgi:hypothetical protein